MAAGREKKKKRISRRRQKRRIQIIGFSVLLLILILTALYLFLDRTVSACPKNVAADNVFVGPINVSGMNRKEITAALETHLDKMKEVEADLKVESITAVASLENLGLEYDNLDKLADGAISYGKEGSLWECYKQVRSLKKEKHVIKEHYILNEETITVYMKEKVAPLAVRAKDAKIKKTSEGFEITPEKDGVILAREKSIEKLTKYLNGKWDYKTFTLDMEFKTDKPDITSADLKVIQDELGKFATNVGGGTRWKNLETGVGKINGLVVMPGEEVSVHDVTAPYDKEHGYVAAGSYENGQVVETYGGGICQVSSTLYNALLYAEVEIVKRYPHSMMVSYVDPSRDAAIAGDVKDLVFKNNYDTPIYIKGEIDSSNQLTFTIYGKDTRKEGRIVKYESEVVSTTEYGTTYKEDSSAPLGSMTSGGSPHTGKEARLWKVVIVNGKEESRENINYSKYNKSDKIIKVGTKSDNPQASVLVRNAIVTQDAAKIQQAIAEAGAL